MKARVLFAAATIVASGLSVLPSGAGQHFGIAPGDVAQFGSETVGAAAPSIEGAGGPGQGMGSASGFFFQGASLSATDASSGPALATVIGCVVVQGPNGQQDWGCLKSQDVPVLFDPLLAATQKIHMEIPSDRAPGGKITADLTFQPAGELTPFYADDLQPPNAPDLSVRLEAGIGRQAHVTGVVTSSIAAPEGVTIDTGGSLRHTVAAAACSLRGAICPGTIG